MKNLTPLQLPEVDNIPLSPQVGFYKIYLRNGVAYKLDGNGVETPLSSFVESDPIFTASAAFNITTQNLGNWNTAYSWGNHAVQGYLTQPVADTLYASLNHTHTFAQITSKPTTLTGYGITDPVVLTTNSYSNPSWITALAWSKITGSPAFLLGTGTTNYIAKWSGTSLVNSIIFENGGVGIGTNNPTSNAMLHVVGGLPSRTKSLLLDSTWDYQTSFSMRNGIYSTEFNLGGASKSSNEGGAGSLQVSTYNASTNTYRYPVTFFANGNVSFAGNLGSVPADNGSTLQVNGTIQQSSVTSALLKASATGVLVAAVPGVDYLVSVVTPTLNTVTTAGNVTTNAITVGNVTVNGNAGTGFFHNALTNYDGFSGLQLNRSDGTERAFFKLNPFSGEVRIGAAGTGYYTTLYTAGVERMRVFAASGNVAINSATDSGFKLDVNGTARVSELTIKGTGVALISGLVNTTSVGDLSMNQSFYQFRTYAAGTSFLWKVSDGSNKMDLNQAGTLRLYALAGTGSRMVVADEFGQLSVQAVPTFTETDTLDSVTDRGDITTNKIEIGGIYASSARTTNLVSELNYFVHRRINSSGVMGFKLNSGAGDTSFWRWNDGSGDVEFGNATNYGLQFYVNNAVAAKFFNNGNLYVGSSPVDTAYKLNVNGQASFSDHVVINTDSSLFAGSAYNGYKMLGIGSTTGGGISFVSSNGIAAEIFGDNTPTGLYLASYGAVPVITFYLNTTEVARYTTAGELQVSNLSGTGSRMVVAAANGILSTQAIPSFTETDTLTSVTTRGNVTTNSVTVGGITTTNSLTIDGTGSILVSATAYGNNARIGTIGGYDFLYGAFRGLFIGSNANSGIWGLSTASEQTLNIWTSAAQSIVFGTSNTARMRILSNGNVLIGTDTDAGYKLDVNGSIATRGSLIVFGENEIRQDGITSHITSRLGIFNLRGWSTGTQTAYFNGWNQQSYINTPLNIGTGSTGMASMLSVYGTRTASSALAQGVFFNTTLVAAANNDVLVGLDINPTFTNGAFTGVSNYGIRLQNSRLALFDAPIYSQAGATASNTAFSITGTSGSHYTIDSSRTLIFNTGQSIYFNTDTDGGNALERAWYFAGARTGTTGGRTYAAITVDGSGFPSLTIYNNDNGGRIQLNSNAASYFNGGNLLVGTTIDAGYTLNISGTFRVTSQADFVGLASPGHSMARINDNGTLLRNDSFVIDNATGNAGQLANLSVGATHGTAARLFAKGLGSTTATVAFLVQNSSGNVLANINDAGEFSVGSSNTFGYKFLVSGITYLNGSVRIDGNTTVNANFTVAGAGGTILTGGRTVVRDGNSFLVGGSPGLDVADASALSEIRSTTKGFLQSRMTNTQVLAIATPATGLQAYDTTNNKMMYYDSAAWRNLASESWVTSQGYLTSQPWVVSGSNVYYTTGDVGIGTSSAPSRTLEVYKGGLLDGQSGGIRITAQHASESAQAILEFYHTYGKISSIATDIGSGGGSPSMYFKHNGINAIKIASTGNVLINTLTDGGYKFDVAGTGRYTGTLTIQSTASDASPSNSILITTSSSGNGGRISWGDSNTSILRYSNSLYFREYTGNFRFESTGSGTALFNISGAATTVTSGSFVTNGSITAASSLARGVYFNNTLVAAANNDVLVGLDINPAFTNGAFTGVSNVTARFLGGTVSGNNGGQIALRQTDSTGIGAVIGIQGGGWGALGFWGPSRYTATNTPDMRVRGNDGGVMIENFLLIGTTTNAGYKLDVVGTARVTSSLAIGNDGAGSATLYTGGNVLYVAGNNNHDIKMPGVYIVRNGAGYGVGIEATGFASVNSSALLTITSTTRGFLQPRMTNTQVNAIASPATGLQAYDTTNNKNVLYNGSAWLNIATESWVFAQNFLTTTSLKTDYTYSVIGVKNSVNTVFTTTSSFATGTTRVYLNGVRLTLGASYDYIETGNNQITFTAAPDATDLITIDYQTL